MIKQISSYRRLFGIFVTATTLCFFHLMTAATLQAQLQDCNALTYTFSINTTGFHYFPDVPHFQPSLGTLLGFKGETSGNCATTAIAENISSSNSGYVTPSMKCNSFGKVGYDAVLGLQSVNIITAPIQGSQVFLSTYDGINDGAGLSGTTQQLGPINISGEIYTPTNIGLTSLATGTLPLTATLYVSALLSWEHPGLIFLPTANLPTGALTYNFSYIYGTPSVGGFDCNGDNISDSCEVILNGALDINGDGIPDYCESLPDCDQDGITDINAIANGAMDCNDNSIPDSCEITAQSSLDNHHYFGNDGIIDTCQGRVTWEKPVNPELGITGATIRAYWISGTATSPQFHTISSTGSNISDNNGKFIIPREYFSLPLQNGEIGRGIKASVTYTDDSGNPIERTIVNYPGWDPLLPLRSSGLNRIIKVPLPIVFQGGVLAEINGGTVEQLRPFLTLDQAASGSNAAIKRAVVGSGSSYYTTHSIPAFPFFAIPSGAPGSFPLWNDGITWGYNNNPLTVSSNTVAENAIAFEIFLSTKVKQALDTITEGGDSSLLPLNIAAHSMGGVISRKWLTNNYHNRFVNRYVSFDGVQGGTTAANVMYGSWFQESQINGISPVPNTTPSQLGWNYSHLAPTSSSQLFISNDSTTLIDAISPFTSALGIGRTIDPGTFTHTTNGHCSRFIGGWELIVDENTHALQNSLPSMISAARFFAYGLQPYIGDNLLPAGNIQSAQYSASPADSTYASVGCNVATGLVVPNGERTFEIETASSGQSNFAFPVDSQSGTMKIRALISSNTASINIYNGATLQAKLNETTVPFGQGFLNSFEIAVSGTVNKTLRFTTTEASWARVHTIYTNNRYLVGDTDHPSYNPSETVIIRARLHGATGNTIVPTSGTIAATITAPDGSKTDLTLFDDGAHGDGNANNGVYANFFTGTTQSGFYQVHYISNYNWVGWPILRSDDNSFEIRSTAATLSPTMTQHAVDSDNNGVTDGWAIDFSISADQTGEYRLSGQLVGSDGSEWLLDKQFMATAGSIVPATLTASLEILHQIQPGVTYTLKNIRLSEQVQGQILGANADLVLTLPALSSLQPLPPPVLSEILPSVGAFDGGYEAIIKGSNLGSAAKVLIGNNKALFQVVANDILSVTVPRSAKFTQAPAAPFGQSNSSSSSGTVAITVVTPSGTATLPASFTYVQ